MFIPMASPVLNTHCANTRRPNTCGRTSTRRPCAVLSAATACSSARWAPSQSRERDRARASARTKQGVMSSASPSTYALAPPASLIARIPYW